MALNEELVGKVLSFLNVEKIESEEDFDNFKQTFNSKFVSKETAHTDEDIKNRVVGKRMGEITSKLVEFGKALGQDVSFDKLRDKKVEDVITEFGSVVTTQLEQLQSKAKEGNDKKLNDLQKELEDKVKSLTSYKEALEQTQGLLAEKESNFQSELKNYKVQTKLKDIRASIPFVDGITDVQRAGFETIINSSYKFDLDEKDNVIVTDKDGNLVPVKDKAGVFADPTTIFTTVADANGLLKKNNLENVKKPVTFERQTETAKDSKKVSTAYELRRKQLGI